MDRKLFLFRMPTQHRFQIVLEIKIGKSIMTFTWGSLTNINPKFYKKIYLYLRNKTQIWNHFLSFFTLDNTSKMFKENERKTFTEDGL
jgi:hypothetical protein